MKKKKIKKCAVFGCPNRSNEGEFVEDFCLPCHSFIVTGEGVYSQVYRNALKILSTELFSLLTRVAR